MNIRQCRGSLYLANRASLTSCQFRKSFFLPRQGNRVNWQQSKGRFHTEVTEKAKPPRATEKVDSASLEVVHFVSLWPLVA
jgi:hypothetical protein